MNRAEPRFAALLLIFTSLWCLIAHADTAAVQTNVDQARHSTDDAGVPHLTISGVGKVDHPAWTALYALAYAGVEDYDPGLGLKADPQRFEASIAWLKANLAQNERGLWVWTYNFDSTYNDVSIKAPWSSAFAQATGIQALLAHWRKTQDPSSLELARKAAESLFVPLSEGGFLFSAGDDIWFEEIPSPVENPSHILNGHMRALLALNELREATGEDLYQKWFGKGSDTLLRWLPLYDAGYWLRYDLNPRKDELLFRLANPYGFANPELAIDRIVLRDPVSGEESVLDVGAANDAEGPLRIAGNDWGQIEQLEGRSVRRLSPVEGERETLGSEGQMVAPYSYFYLALPGKWQNNLRKEGFELAIEYLDEKSGNLEIQMRSISPASESFKKLKDSDLLISGVGTWRQWQVNVNPSDLGYWVGKSYANKHKSYLELLADTDSRLLPWADAARAYLNALEPGESFQTVTPKKIELPRQTPMLPIYSLDKDGVLMQHLASAKTKFDSKGMYDPTSDRGKPMYSPYIIASQLIEGPNTPGAAYSKIESSDIQRAPALAWFKSLKNQVNLGEAVTYSFPFPNVYNDVATSPPWPSAFSQAYVLKALRFTSKTIEKSTETQDLLRKSAYAYEVPVSRGGISSFDKSGLIYFEEVPNATHVLNAHLISTPELAETADQLDDSRIQSLKTAGIDTLRAKLSQFDTGYWMRYDLNPKKELIFQLDWLAGEESPLIESISLEAPQFAKQIQLYVGSEQAFEGASRISGMEWSTVQQVDGKQARSFANGYLAHKEAVQGGTQHNVYLLMQLPETKFPDYFDVQPHRLVIHYKDVSAGKFVVKIQSINEGNALEFTPLRNSVISTTGDQQWKEATVEIRPQDMGWYKGADYQVFEVEQLERIAKLTGDWFFTQYAERQRYFLKAKAKGEPVTIQPVFKPTTEPVGLSILKASPTYENFGFENAVDGDPNDDYVAGLEGEADEYVELALDRPVSRALLGLHWESRNNYAKRVKIFALGTNGSRQQLVSASIEDGEAIELNLEATQPFQSIRIEFSEPVGQSRVLLRQISLSAIETPLSETKIKRAEEVFLEATDKNNPLHIFSKPISMQTARLSNKLSQGSKDETGKVNAFIDYINGLSVGVPTGPALDDIISGEVGHCGSFSELLVGLAAVQGIQGRIYYLYDWPRGSGHVLAELKIGGAWQLYDPTYGAFYYKDNDYQKKLSFDEVMERFSSNRQVSVAISKSRDGVEDYTGKDLFIKSSPAQLVSPDVPFTFPLRLSAKQSGNSLALVKGTPEFSRLLGGELIGAGYINQQQHWLFNELTPGKRYRFKIVAGAVQGQSFKLTSRLLNGDETFREHTLLGGSLVEFTFKAKAGQAELFLEHSYKGLQRRYMNIERYDFESVDG